MHPVREWMGAFEGWLIFLKIDKGEAFADERKVLGGKANLLYKKETTA